MKKTILVLTLAGISQVMTPGVSLAAVESFSVGDSRTTGVMDMSDIAMSLLPIDQNVFVESGSQVVGTTPGSNFTWSDDQPKVEGTVIELPTAHTVRKIWIGSEGNKRLMHLLQWVVKLSTKMGEEKLVYFQYIQDSEGDLPTGFSRPG